MKKRILSLVLVISMVIGISAVSMGQSGVNPSIEVNDKPISQEKESYLDESGVLMVPLRSVAEKLDYSVNWNNEDRSVTLSKLDQEVILKIGNKEVNINGEIQTIENTPVIKEYKTYVPAELLSKSLDLVLGWNSKKQNLRIRDIESNNEEIFNTRKDKEIQEKLNSYMMALEEYENFHGSILVAKGGEILLNEGYGYSDFAQNIENKPQTRFSIGSVTKQFAAFSALNLSEQGKLNVDDTISKYMPEFPNGDKITIHNLLTHTSGLKNYTDLPEFFTVDTTNKDPMEMLNLIKDMELVFKPGETFQYSNTNYLLLGIIIEKITGETFEEYLDHIINPLNMKNTGLIYGEKGGVNDATPYTGFLEVTETDDDIVLTQAYAAGSMYSTAEDLYRWDRAIKKGEVLGEETLKEIFKEHIDIPGGGSYGYGWMISDTDMGKEIYHGGNTIGSTSYIGRLIDEDITIIILTNSWAYDTNDLKNNLQSIVLGEEYEMPEKIKEIEIEDKSLYSKYTGKYEYLNGTYLSIIENENKLYAQVTGQGAFEIYPKSTTDFFAKIQDINIEFVMGEEKAKELVFSQAGLEFVCKRIEDNEEKIEVEIDSKVYDDYVGEYELQKGFTITITKEENRLFAQATGQDKFEIFPSSETEFFYKVIDAKITFEKDENGKTTNLILSQMGRDMPAEKIK